MLVEDCVIKKQTSNGLEFSNSPLLTIIGCTIENNGDGINCSNSNLEVSGCTIQDNSSDGVYATSASAPTITNNIIRNNKDNGLYTNECGSIIIKNNWIYRNGHILYLSKYSGLYLKNSISPPLVRNNTIYGNTPYGIYVAQGRDPCLVNNIIWKNGSSDYDNIYSEIGLEDIEASYCCIKGGFPGIGNIGCDPCFRNPDINDFHLKDDSNCIDIGDPLAVYEDETDIDGRPRVIYGRVDIGADEWANPPDYNWDGFINFFDFAVFAQSWLADDPDISLDSDTDVDSDDLERFTECWLWTAYRNKSDYNQDFIVDFLDFNIFAQTWDGNIETLAEFCRNWLWRFYWD